MFSIFNLLSTNNKEIYSFYYFDGAQIKLTFHSLIAVIFFVSGCITDWLDGYLARRWHVESNFGKLYDPLIDKVLVIGMLIIFIVQHNMFLLVPILLIIRDVMMDIIRTLMSAQKIIIPASFLAKAKTMCQMIGIMAVMLMFNRSSIDSWTKEWMISTIALLPALIFSCWSFVKYMVAIHRQLY